jgi:hypothetical protein
VIYKQFSDKETSSGNLKFRNENATKRAAAATEKLEATM